nr:MAG TPA: hypothetical protein [Caudoviricetes sp.]DAZ42608.1 MAG TPA: hypothetical protein [Caudoviricetes sp.]
MFIQFEFDIITISIYVIVLPHCNSLHDYILMALCHVGVS